MTAKSLHELFIHELKDLYDGEHQIVEALQSLIRKSQAGELRTAFELHLEQTRTHIQRLEQIFQMMGETAERVPCKGVKGLVAEGEEITKETNRDQATQDAAMIAAAQKVEHYEMATYGTLRSWARLMGHEQAADLLQQTLDEEGATDHKLTDISTRLNPQAT